MRKVIAISIALLFSLFTTGLHVDLHTCMTEMSCEAMPDDDGHACCQTEKEAQPSNSCCDDTHLDYHLHGAAFIPAQSNDLLIELPGTVMTYVDQPDLEEVDEIHIDLREEIPDPGEPLYSLFECRKLDC